MALAKFKAAAMGVRDGIQRESAMKGSEFFELLKEAQREEDKSAPRIKVCVRVRCFIKEELAGERSGGVCQLCIAMPTKTTVQVIPQENMGMQVKNFEFDRAYWSHDKNHPLYATQETLQEELGQSMIEQALMGYNNCIFAYGQTGSGKSFSVLGGQGEDRGLLPRVVEGLFQAFEHIGRDLTCKTRVCFVEIYNESIHDLLAERTPDGYPEKKLEVKQHPVVGTFIPGLTEAAVGSCEEVLRLVEYGTGMRHTSATAMNATSSRSHCIFTFKTSVCDGEGQATMSQTHLVDLAGSERAGRTKATGQRLKEGAAINQSLSALAQVISELAKKNKSGHPPFRNSKLTYILKESLSGNSKTVMMAAISPNLADYDETLSTIKFAQSVKLVQTKVVANQVNEKGIEAQLRKEIEELQQQLASVKEQSDPVQQEKVQKRLDEQEQLCRFWNKDWDTLLAEERKRMHRRMSHCPEMVQKVQALVDVGAVPSIAVSALLPRSDTASSPAQKGEDSDGSISEAEAQAHCTLAYLHAESSGRRRSSIRVRRPNALALTGPAVMSVMKSAEDMVVAKAHDTTRELSELREHARAAEEACDLLSSGTDQPVRLRAILAVEALHLEDTDELDASTLPSLELIVQATKADGMAEFVRINEFRRRLAWLKAQQATGAAIGTIDDPWVAAAKAAGASPAFGERSSSGSSAEVEGLKAELQAARAEVSMLRARAQAAEHRAVNAEYEARVKELERIKASQPNGGAALIKNSSVASSVAASFERALGTIASAQRALQEVNDNLRGQSSYPPGAPPMVGKTPSEAGAPTSRSFASASAPGPGSEPLRREERDEDVFEEDVEGSTRAGSSWPRSPSPRSARAEHPLGRRASDRRLSPRSGAASSSQVVVEEELFFEDESSPGDAHAGQRPQRSGVGGQVDPEESDGSLEF